MSARKSRIRRALAVGALCLQASLAAAQETPPPAAQRPIPYKSEPVPLEEQGMRTGLVLLLLLGVTGAALYLLRRRLPGLTPAHGQASRLRVAERVRLNPRCTLYLLQLGQRELLIAQCGDRITQLDASPLLPTAGQKSEVGNG